MGNGAHLGALLACTLFGCAPRAAPSPAGPPPAPAPARSVLAAATPATEAATFEGEIEIDAHVHAFRKGLGSDVVLPLLDAARVRRAVLISAGYALKVRDEARAENDFVAAEIARSPRLSGYCGVHPLEAWAVEELRRCVALPGMIGFKLHVNEQGLDLAKDGDLAAVERLFAEVEVSKPVVLFHADKSWRVAVKLAERHPDAQVVLAHGLMHEFRDLAYLGMRFAIAKKRGGRAPKNLFADVSGLVTYYADSPFREDIAWQLRQLGVDRIVFGSDYPLFEPQETRAALQRYGFTKEELQAILVDTPRRVFASRKAP